VSASCPDPSVGARSCGSRVPRRLADAHSWRERDEHHAHRERSHGLQFATCARSTQVETRVRAQLWALFVRPPTARDRGI